jgi:hypothetical protein
MGRHARSPLSTVQTRASNCLDLVHADLVGPIEETLLGRSNYALVMLDDATRFSEVRCLEAKTDAEISLLEVATV